MRYFLYLIILFITTPTVSIAFPINEINSDTGALEHFPVAFRHDKENALSIDNIVNTSFKSITNQHSFGIDNNITWYKITFNNTSNLPIELYLHNKLAFMSKKIDIYEFINHKKINHKQYDLFSSESVKQLSGSILVYPFTLNPLSNTTLYIKNHVLINQLLDLQIYSKHDSTQALINHSVFSNIIITILLTLAVYNVMLSLFSHHTVFIFYSLYLFNAALGLFYMYGSVFHHTQLFGEQVYWFNSTAFLVSVFLALFIKSIFNTEHQSKKITALLNSIIIISLIGLISVLFISLPFATKFVSVIFLYSFFIISYVGYYFYQKNHPLAIIFCIAYSIYIFSFSITLLVLVGVISYNSLAFHSSGIGLVFEAFLFSYMINYRIKLLEKEVVKHNNIILLKNKKAQMSDMIAAITHQWKQPLTAISSIITLLQYQVDDKKNIPAKELKEKYAKIDGKIQFLSETINDFRYFFESEKIYIKRDIAKIINQAIIFLNDDMMASGIIVKTDLNFKKQVPVYKNELLHIILNIMQNSKEAFNLANKSFDSDKNNDQPKTIKIIGFTQDDHMIIDIMDNAGGILEKNLPHIFDEFYSTKEQHGGSGLGLYLSQFIIKDHMNGSISAINLDDGVKFRITI